MEEQIGPYQVVAELGRGGMGVVYKARDSALERFVAIKVLGDKVADDAELIARFQREARSAASLNHPNVIQIYNIGDHQGQPYFVMEFVEGLSLSQMIRKEGRIEPQTAARILVQAASGLAAAHEKEIIHRDIKPGNLMIDRRGNVKIADFGIAYMAELGKKLTGTGQFLGTPGYLSPELCQGLPLDGRADIFSLGVVFFEMLTGQQPFQADSPFAMIHKVVQSPLPDVAQLNPEVDAHTIDMLNRMVAKKPEDRYPDCELLIRDLEQGFGVQTYRTLGDRPARDLAAAGPAVDESKTATDANMVPTEYVPAAAPPPLPTEASLGPPPPPVPPAETVATPSASGPPTNPSTSAATGPIAGPSPAGKVTAKPQSAPPTGPPPRSVASSGGRGKAGLMIAAAAFLVFGVGAVLWWGRQSQEAGPTETADTRQAQKQPTDTAAAANQSGVLPTEPATDPQNQASPESDATVIGADPQPNKKGPTADMPPPIQTPQTARAAGEPAAIPQPQAQPNSTAMAANQPDEPVETTSFPESEPALQASDADQPQITRPRQRMAAKSDQPQPRVPGQRAVRAKPEVPNVVVAVLGDPTISGPIRVHLENHLSRDDYPILALDDMRDPSDLIQQQPLPILRLRQALKRHETDVLVLVRVDERGERNISFRGRNQTAWQAQVQVSVLSLHQKRPLGRLQGTEMLEYTNLSAGPKAKIAALKIYQQVSEYMEAY
ncbi:serine/threonine-protein kinase [Acanthopleuribacter pedis]|uniref:Protein kinase n=1 Tax=Acanthopleuribacter pedis TaxID=442870 RepID=A0A8J7QI78_9BACT|nr:serine/threonine-protein kinase [Acanthopleuribacter pedis]MBO1318713.1 protein kinase [Acanthopleuribacter pedis]